MVARKPVAHFTVVQYVALEAVSVDKHEYWNGQLFAMADGSPAHSAVCQQVGSQLEQALKDKPCVAFQSDARVAVSSNGLYFYADAFVACAPISYDPLDALAVSNPVVVVEVLSPATEDYDRGEKLDAYRTNAHLRDIVLIDVEARTVEHWFRHGEGWDRAIRDAGSISVAPGVVLSIPSLWSKLDLLR